MRNQSMLVLLIEDNPDHADLIKSCLLRHPLVNQVIHISDGDQALNYLSEQEAAINLDSSSLPNLILLDLRLPKVDGLDVLRKFRVSERYPRIPIVVLSTSATNQDISEAYRVGANGYAVKPFDYNKLQQLITDICSYWLAWNYFPISETMTPQDENEENLHFLPKV
jgi:two-component system, response regulator